jgi:MFS transporter, ACDE family, multidrug resistance protein
MGIVGWRALWGLGNALFIATALATIVSSAQGSVAQAIILYEAALGLGIAVGPLIGGVLGSISWRGPFFGVSALMAVALVVTAFLLPATPRARTASSAPFNGGASQRATPKGSAAAKPSMKLNRLS